MDCSPPGSSVHGIFRARILEWEIHFFLQGIFPTRGSNLHLLCYRLILYCWPTREAHGRFEMRNIKSISYFDKHAREALIEGRWNEPSISWNKIRGEKWWENVYLCSLIPFLTTAGISLKPAVPSVFGTSDRFYGRQFVHGWGGRMLQVVMWVMGSSRWTFSC